MELAHRALIPEDASIVRAIISLAHGQRLKVVAERVETPEQLQLLAELGCEDSPLTKEDAVRTHSKLAGLKG